jgi:hypothetical protein
MAIKPYFILTSNGPIAVYFGTVTKTVARTDAAFPKLIEMLREDNPATTEEILTFLDPSMRIKAHACGLFDVCNGGVYINGERTPDLFAKRALEMADLGLNVRPLLALWANIKMNPDPVAVKDLYTFLDRRQHPITDDGCFIAYKRVRDNFTDHYTGTIDNSVGVSPSMPRNEVDCNPKNTCSRGLHVASLEYARDQYQSGCGVLIAIKVHPKNVCAIPPDYNMTKMRTCGYDVLEVMVDVSKPITKPVYNAGVDNQAEAQKTPEEQPLFVLGDSAVADKVGARRLRADGHRPTDKNHLRQPRDAHGHFIRKH